MQVGEVRGKVRVHGCLSRVVTVKGSEVELKEVVICDGTGEISVTRLRTATLCGQLQVCDTTCTSQKLPPPSS
ncbi:unnamed protein product [Leuciscus chuanchicus]